MFLKPQELEQIQTAFDSVIAKLGSQAPLGLKEAIAAELLAGAGEADRTDLLQLIDDFLIHNTQFSSNPVERP